MITRNSECAELLFQYLVKHQIVGKTDAEIKTEILHDINTGLGHIWLSQIPRNLETHEFFDYLGSDDFLYPNFPCKTAISPEKFASLVFSDWVHRNCGYNGFTKFLQKHFANDLWDYDTGDLAEALENNEYLVAIAFYNQTGYTIRILELTEDMAVRLS